MSRGQGYVFQPVDGKGRRQKVWHIGYQPVGGKYVRESSGTTNKTEALRIMRQRIGDRESGKIIGRPDRVFLAVYEKDAGGKDKLVGGLRWLHETQYDLDGLRSKDRIVDHWNRLEKFFPAPTPVTVILNNPTRLDEYAKARLAQGATRQTINNELSTLRRGFSLAVEKRLLAVGPIIKLPRVQNARKGFFEDGDLALVLMNLPKHLRPVYEFLRYTGWRIEEVLTLMWAQVDREGEVIRLHADETKGKAGRVFPYGRWPELKALLDRQWEQPGDCPFVFHKNGQRIPYTTQIKQFKRACTQAGLVAGRKLAGGRVTHDLRRTAVRAMRRAGLSEGVIMKLCGMKTRSIFDRYNIVDEADLAEDVAKAAAFNNSKVMARLSPSPVPS
jgi:integrase